MTTRDGGTVTVTRYGSLVDLHVRDRDGRTVATVVRHSNDPGFPELYRDTAHTQPQKQRD